MDGAGAVANGKIGRRGLWRFAPYALPLAAIPFRRLPGGARLAQALHRLDRWLFRAIPASRKLAWIVVLRLQR